MGMKKEKKYNLNILSYFKDNHNNIIHNLYVSAETIKEKNIFFNSTESYSNKTYNKEYEFDYLTPFDIEGDTIEHICDYHSWIREKPDNLFSNVVSKRFGDLLNRFKLYPNQFYKAKVLFNEEYHPYYVWQFFSNSFDQFVDFEHSTFCHYDYDREEKFGNKIIKVNSLKELKKYRTNNGWEQWGFEKAVMKSEFATIDCLRLTGYGTIISERLKDAIEAVNPKLTGLEIKPCPLEFEYV